MEGNLAILEGNYDWVPGGKKHIFSAVVDQLWNHLAASR